MAKLDLVQVTKSFGPTQVLRGIDLSVEDGAFVAFVGPSGCGKSTLLRLICGLDEVTSGTIAIDGQAVNDVPPAQRGIAMVFQSYALYPHMSVAANMGYALKLAGMPKAEIRTRVERAAATLRLEPYLDRKPRQLSGGQRQRVAIGRAIVREPRIFLFDEPLSNLDAALRVEMRLEIARMKQRLGTTMIYVTHDQIEAMTLADKIVVLNAGQVEQVGSPLDLYERPANRFVAAFIGSPRMNILDLEAGAWADGAVALPGGRLHVGQPTGVPRALGIRPEHCELVAPGTDGSLPATVTLSEHLGSDTYAYVTLRDTQTVLVVRLPGEQTVRSGEPTGLLIDPARIHLFDREGRTLPSTPALARSAA